MFRCLSFIFLILTSNNSLANKSIITVKTAVATNAEFYKHISLPAECLSLKSKEYYARSDGFIDIIPEHNKSYFQAGELILAIDKSQAESAKIEAEEDFKAAKNVYDKDNILLKKNVISVSQYDKSKNLYHMAKSRLAEATKNYSNKIIHAPFSGNISTIKFKEGEYIKSGEFLFNIIASHEKLIRFSIPQTYKINASTASGYVLHNGKEYKLEKISISKSLSDNYSNYEAIGYIFMDNELDHNSYVSVALKYDIHVGIAVPEKALIKAEGISKLFILENENHVKLITVEVSDRLNEMIEITTNNIAIGTHIVTEGIQKLSDNDVVELIE